MMKLVEQTAGVGEVMRDGVLVAQVRYRLNRFQGLMEGSGLPIPGVHRIEGSSNALLPNGSARRCT